MKAAILVDENNAVSMLHSLGVEGIRPWKAFYDALYSVLKRDYGDCQVDYRFYGAIPPKHIDMEKFYLRKRFFSALEKDGIEVHKGFCQSFGGGLVEKGVDVLVALDLFQMSLNQYDLLFIFSADGDLYPAVQRAQNNGSKVVAILSERQPASLIKKLVDGVVPLEAVIDLIDDKHLIRRPNTKHQTIGEMNA
ncbi:NYN domain-containing protein [Paenibacillus aestuarii]|uniref:NYN domain-containing protein n=1 Tax=Paenibacillus aestuarii TaxID=516965 RepID=A0ABW0K7A7_9BACL